MTQYKVQVLSPYDKSEVEVALENSGVNLSDAIFDGVEVSPFDEFEKTFTWRISKHDFHENDNHPLHSELDHNDTLCVVYHA